MISVCFVLQKGLINAAFKDEDEEVGDAAAVDEWKVRAEKIFSFAGLKATHFHM